MTSTSLSLPTRLPDSAFAVETRELRKQYGTRTALKNVALQVPVGAVYLLVGANGAGKSTMLKVLLDLLRADAGAATVFGLDVRRHGARVRANVGYVPERLEWGYKWMRVDRLLDHHAAYFPSWDASYAAHVADAFQIQMTQRLGTLSKGQVRRVHLLMALAHRPPLLVLDEPTDGLDPLMRDQMLGVLVDHLAATPTTVLISTHHVEEVERLADHIGVLSNGELRAQIPIDTLHRDLRRYRADVPDGWTPPSSVTGTVIDRVSTPREIQWIAWGKESEIAGDLERAGATVREIAPLSLVDATLCLLKPRA